MRHRGTVGTLGLSAIVAVGLFASAALAGEDYEALPPMERVKKDLLGIQNNITNAKMRLQRELSGAASGAADATGDRPPTPAEACCSSNLLRIKEKIRRLSGTLEQLDVYYSGQGNTMALGELAAIRDRLGVVSQGIAIFKLAATRSRAGEALAGCIRPFTELRAATLSLEACCPVPEPAAKKKAPK